MSSDCGCSGANKLARKRKVASQWVGWTDRIAHPDAPAGGGGPGYFATADGGYGTPRAADGIVSPDRPGPLGADAETPKGETVKPKPPPATQARTLSTTMSVQTDFVDIEIDAKVLDDAHDQSDVTVAVTRFELPTAGSARYEADTDGVSLKSATSKLKWKGSITIQTRYEAGVSASDLTCYGRGTTAEDIKNGDVTIGFHESCHIAHFAGYLAAHPLPAAPDIKAGMKLDKAAELANKFIKDTEDYAAAARKETVTKVDEVGVKMSSGKCYDWPPIQDDEE